MSEWGKKRAWPGSRDTVHFLALNANSSKMVKDANFKFGTHNPRQSTDMTPEKNSRKGAGRRGKGYVTPNFWALNANSSQMAKGSNF